MAWPPLAGAQARAWVGAIAGAPKPQTGHGCLWLARIQSVGMDVCVHGGEARPARFSCTVRATANADGAEDGGLPPG